jgi:hypothetical protein
MLFHFERRKTERLQLLQLNGELFDEGFSCE